MSDLLRKAISLGVGVAVASKEKIEQLAEELVAKGELGRSESKDFVKQLLAKGEEQRSQVKTMVQDQVRRILEELDVATKRDVAKLEERLTAKIEARIEARFAAERAQAAAGEAGAAPGATAEAASTEPDINPKPDL